MLYFKVKYQTVFDSKVLKVKILSTYFLIMHDLFLVFNVFMIDMLSNLKILLIFQSFSDAVNKQSAIIAVCNIVISPSIKIYILSYLILSNKSLYFGYTFTLVYVIKVLMWASVSDSPHSWRSRCPPVEG